ncbi:hypothetical protein F5879DRAFT_925857 [Lentinula edodes]|nr:hypothetical protein F5879DRAFT_925857 [Lentinula edodes]
MCLTPGHSLLAVVLGLFCFVHAVPLSVLNSNLVPRMDVGHDNAPDPIQFNFRVIFTTDPHAVLKGGSFDSAPSTETNSPVDTRARDLIKDVLKIEHGVAKVEFMHPYPYPSLAAHTTYLARMNWVIYGQVHQQYYYRGIVNSETGHGLKVGIEGC